MALSKDNREYPAPAEALFNLLLGLLPQLNMRVLPYEGAYPTITSQNPETNEIKIRVQPQSANTPAYNFTFRLEAAGPDRTRLNAETSTFGLTDLGLGQMTLRQLLVTVSLAIKGRLEAGQLPVFFHQPTRPWPGSPQAQAEAAAHRAFDLGRRGYPEDALNEFKASLALDPRQPEVYYYMGVLQMLIGRLSEAAQAFQAAISLEPHHLLAGAYLEDVQARIRQVGPALVSPFTMPTKVINPTSPAAGSSSAPYRVQTPKPMNTPLGEYAPAQSQAPAGVVNEDRVPTRPTPLIAGGWLFLRGDGTPVAEYKLCKPVTTLGRREDGDLVLMDAKISRQHAEIIERNGIHFLRDLRSANGTRHNGRKLAPGEEVPLRHGDRLRLGEIEITYINSKQQ